MFSENYSRHQILLNLLTHQSLRVNLLILLNVIHLHFLSFVQPARIEEIEIQYRGSRRELAEELSRYIEISASS